MRDGSSQSSVYDFFSQNLYSRTDKDIVAEFLENSKKVKARKNGNYLFHEVISITKSKQLTLDQEKERLFDIIRTYTASRCKNNLVAGYLHDEKENNIHYHLMISSNEIDVYKNQRLTKFDFDKVKRETEKYVIDKYPELEQDILISAKKEQNKNKQSNKAAEVKRKGGRLEKKEKITNTLRDIFSVSSSMNDFFNRLATKNIEMYNRGSTIGFINGEDNKKYRLKTLELENEFKQINELINQPSIKKTKKKVYERNSCNMNSDDDKVDKKQQTTQSSFVKPETAQPQSEIEKRKAEIKKVRDSIKSQQKDKSKGKDKGFDR